MGPRKTETSPARMTIEYRPLREVQRAPRNPNGHDLPAIKASIVRHGFVEPPVVDARTGFLVGGHGRLDILEAMRDAGELVPARIDVEGDDWLVPVVVGWASQDDADAEAMLLSMMRLPKAAVAQPDTLLSMLEQLVALPSGLDGTGYVPADLDVLLAQAAAADPSDPDGEWERSGMPEFGSADRQSRYATTVHFTSTEDADRFWSEVFGETSARRTAWWPKHDGFVGSDQKQEWVAEA